MPSWRSGAGALVAISVATVVVLWPGKGRRPEIDAAPPPNATGITLVGYLDGPGVDPTRCEARALSMRLESNPILHRAPLDEQGRFELTGLSDVDYRIEIVVRSNPALVVGRMEHVRPGGSEVVIETDPTRLFGPAGSLGDFAE